jgi:hypothetical protein
MHGFCVDRERILQQGSRGAWGPGITSAVSSPFLDVLQLLLEKMKTDSLAG